MKNGKLGPGREDFSDVNIRPAEKHETDVKKINNGKLKITMEKIKMEQPNIKGVESTKKVIKFIATGYDSVTDALADDKKISVMEALGIGASLAPQALGTFKALPEVPKELVFDKISEEDMHNLVSAFDEIKNIKGNPIEATKELLPIINQLKDWGLKYFGQV